MEFNYQISFFPFLKVCTYFRELTVNNLQENELIFILGIFLLFLK